MTELDLGAVGYGRVSTKEQAKDNNSLPNQQKDVRAYCAQKNLTFERFFEDPGFTGGNLNRPEFQEMVAYLRANKRRIKYVVVNDLSRLSRDAKDQANFMCELEKLGIKLRSVKEPNVDETPAGRLFATMFGGFNQLFRDTLKERTKERMRASVEAGRFPWPAPIGYMNRNGKGKAVVSLGPGQANMVPDPERAHLIRKAFELIATGRYAVAEVLRLVNGMGLRTRTGKPLSAQTLNQTLRKEVYCGWVCSPEWDLRVKGLHEPIITQKLFDDVQAILDGKKPTASARKRFNPEFPLKVFVRCGVCGKAMTGGWISNGHSEGRRFGYYWCHNSQCRASKLRKEVLEEALGQLLDQLTIDSEALRLFPKFVADIQKREQGDSEAITKTLLRQLEDKQSLKQELLTAKLRREVSQADYEQANSRFDAEIREINQQLGQSQENRATVEQVVKFSMHYLGDIGGLWRRLPGEHKQRVQSLLFSDGLRYSPETRTLNHSNSSLFNQLRDCVAGKNLLASPAGFEPALPP